MKEKRISFCQGKGSLTHNNRDFIAENVDRSRIKDNITFISQPVGETYEQLFGESTERYNARQKRNDRKIHSTYYESLFHQKPSSSVVTAADKRKSFYEDIVQVGKMEDSGIGTEDAELVADCLKEFMAGFQQRNPNFYVFNAVLHMDEATPHLHIDYIPIGHYKRGQDIQNGIAQALKEMGFGEGKGAIARWRASEIEVLNKICLEHGIQPLPPEKSRGTMTVEEYKEAMRETEQLKNENAQLKSENEVLAVQLSDTKSELEKASKKKARLIDIDNIEIKHSVFGNKVTMAEEDYNAMHDLAKKEIVSEKQTKKLKAENAELKQKVSEQSAELAKLKKPATISRDALIRDSKRISETEKMKSEYRKVMSFISECGLSENFRKFRPNTRKNELE